MSYQKDIAAKMKAPRITNLEIRRPLQARQNATMNTARRTIAEQICGQSERRMKPFPAKRVHKMTERAKCAWARAAMTSATKRLLRDENCDSAISLISLDK